MSTLQTFRRHRKPLGGALAVLMAAWQIGQPLQAAPNDWDGSTDNAWGDATNWSVGVPTATDNLFFGLGLPNRNIILGAGSLADSLSFMDNYSLSTNDLTLTSGDVRVGLGYEATVGSQLTGGSDLTLTGGGTLRLTNASNNYTGTTTIRNGNLVINSAGALGGTGTVSVLTTNDVPSNGSLIGFGGGSLVLDGTTTGFTLSRDVNVDGRGQGNYGAGILSLGNNTLSGTIATAVNSLSPVTFRNSRLSSVNGTLTLSGTANMGGTATTTFTVLGGVNSAGVGNIDITGVLAGTGSIEKAGAGTLFLNPSSASGFTGTVRLSSSATGQQSSIRVTQTGAFGTNTGTAGSSGIDLNGGVLEFRSDGNLDFGALAGGKNVRLRASSTIYTGPAAGGSAINGTTTLGTFRLDANQTATFVSRNGFGVTLGTWGQESTNNNNTITTNMGGTLRFTGNAWNNDDAAARTLTISGTGNTVIAGSITAATTSGNKGLTKSGSGLLTIIGTGTTLPGGTVAIQQGSIAVTDFRSIAASGTAATSIASLNLGSSQNQGSLIIGTTTTPTAAGLTTSKVLSLVGTTGGGAIIANQTGANPVIFNAAAVTVTGTSANGGAKTLTLGGVNTADNIINSNIPNGPVSDATTLAAATSTASTSVSLNSVAGLIVGSTITLPNSGGTRTITAIDPLTRVVTIDTVPAAGTSSGTVTGAGLVAPVSITKVGGGTWALGGTAGGNTYTGATTLSNGTLKLRANAATSTVIENTAPIRFDQTNQFAGATLDFVGQASTSNVETLGQLTLTQGANTLRLTPGATGGTASLVFGALNPTIGDGGTINVLGSTLTSTVTLTGVATGLVSPHFYIGGSDFARSNSGVLVAPVYGTDATFVAAPAGATLPAGTNQNYSIDGNITAAVSGTAGTLKFNGGQALTLAASQTLTIRTGAAGTDGGILATGGTSSISGGTGLTTGGNGAMIIRVNGINDLLTINSPLTTTSSGGWTKSGAGTLVLTSTANAIRGTKTINEGTVRLSGAGSGLGVAAGALTIRQNATLDLNGVTPGTTTGAFNNNGTVTSSAAATFTVGGGNGTGTSYGIISGAISVVKTGTGAQSWLGDSTYTGVTTIGSTGLVTVDTLAIGGTASGIGASTSAASNLVFDGSTGGLVYQGNIIDPSTGLTLGSRSATTDRLFTLAAAATGATISSTVSNNNAITWTSTGPIVNNTTAPATLIFGGTSLGDNTFNPQLVDSSVALGVNKTGAGQWNLGNSANSYTGITRVTEGVLAFNASGALPTNSPLILGNNATSGTVQMSGTLSRTLTLAGSATAGSGTISFGGTTGGGGFASHGGALTVSLNGGAGLTWGADGFVGTGGTQSLFLNSVSSLSSVDFQNAIDLGAAVRTISVQDNTTTGADYAILSGDLTGTGGGILKAGAGVLKLTGDNAYTGNTNVEGGTIVVSSLGASSGASTSSVGAGNVTMDNNNAIVLGNATTTGGILQYVGPGETSDRLIRLRGTSASSQIHADGSGPLILTEVRHDTTETGNKTLNLRGSNTGGNQITSALTDNGAGVLTVTVDGGATWILTNPGNTFTGNLNASAGALGIGDDNAVGATATGVITNNNGNIFAYGADRTISRGLTMGNNATNGWFGDYSLTFSGNNVLGISGATNNTTTNNSIVAGKTLTFNGLTANALPNNTRTWTIDGTGETVVNGNFTSTVAGTGVAISKTGNGTLTLGTSGTGSNWNQGSRSVDIDRGTLKFTVNNAMPSGVGFGGLVLSPEGITSDTATVQLNGTNQEVSLLTATSSGTSIIDNNSAAAVSLTFGADNTSSAFGTGGTGTYSITQSGGGAISLTKTGTGTYNFTGTLGNTGTVTSNGGVLNINSASLATSAIGDGGTLNFKGGFTTPGNLDSVTADNGGLVSFADGVGTPFTNLATLNLSLTANSGLELDAGDSGTDTLTTLSASVANVTTLFIKDIDLDNLQTYDLILAPGGLGTGANYSLNLPGYTGSTLSVTSTAVRLITGTLITNDVYWNNGTGAGGGTLTSAWNTVDGTTTNINFSSDFGGLTTLTTNANLPGKGQKVIFQGDNITGGAPLATTLEQGFTVNALEFRASTNAADTSRTISIAPGAVASNSLTIKPSASTDGINLLTGGVGSVTISAPLVAGLDQTWTVADAPVELLTVTSSAASNTLTVSSTAGLRPGMAITGPGIPAGTTIVSLSGGTTVTLSGTATATSTAANLLANQQLNVTGSLSGAGDVVKAGLGTVVISGVNANLTGTYTNNAGLTQVTTLSGLGGQVGVPGSGTDITVSGGIFALNAASNTFVNDITLNGGTLSGGTGNHTYSGAVAVNADSTINMRDLGQSIAISSTTARNITLSGVVTGTSAITIDSVDVAGGGNRLNGNVVFNNSANTWSGDLNMTRGSVFFQNVAGVGNATPYAEFTGDINFNQYGRVVYRNLDAQTLNRTGTLSVAGSAIGELSADNVDTLLATNYVVNQQGQVSLNANSALRLSVDDGSAINLTGGVVLNGSASISVQGSAQADNLVTISGTGISGTGPLALNDELGGWGVTSRTIRIDAAGTYSGGTTLNEGTLILGIKDALSTGSLTITGASTLQAGVNLTGANAVANAVTLNQNLTVSGSNSLELTGAFTGMGTDAARTLTNSLPSGETLSITGTSTTMNLASVTSTSGRALTIAGAGNTFISQSIANGNTQANGITKTGSGTLTLANTNTYTGTTTLSAAAATNNGVILATASNALGTGGFTAVMSDGTTSIGQLQLSGGITLANSGFTTSGVGSDGTSSGIIRSISGSNTLSGPVNMTGGGGASTYRSDSGATLIFGGNVGAVGGNTSRIINLVGGGDFVFNGVIQNFNDGNAAGTVGLNSTNTGTTTLNNVNTYTLATTVTAGTLVVGINDALPNASAITVGGAGSATLSFGAFNDSIGNLTLGSAAGTAGSVSQVTTGAGTVTLLGNVNTVATGNPTTAALISGNVALDAGTRTFDVANSTGSAVDLNLTGIVSGAGALTKTGAGTLSLNGTAANTFSGLTTVSAGALILNKSAGVNAIIGDGLSSKSTADVLINGGTLTFGANDQLDDSVYVNVTSGTLNFNNFNETLYNLNVSGGSVNYGTGDVTIEDPTWSGGTNTISGNTTFGFLEISGGANTVTGTNTGGAGTLTIGTASTSGPLSFSGSGSSVLTVNSDDATPGSVRFRAGSTIDLVFSGTGSATGLITSSGTGSNLGRVDLNGSTRTFNIGDAAGSAIDMTIAAEIVGTGAGITKTGAGTLALTVGNTFDGGTTVSTGTLLVNNTSGSATGTGLVQIDPGATLGGSGIISGTGAVTVQGILDVGNVGDSGGQDLLINTTAAINLTGATLNFDLWTDFTSGVSNAFPASDLLSLNGSSINISGATLNVSASANGLNTWAYDTAWRLFDWNSITPSNNFGALNLPDLSGWDVNAVWDTNDLLVGGTIKIVNAIPEPSRAMLLLLGLLSLGFRRRRDRF